MHTLQLTPTRIVGIINFSRLVFSGAGICETKAEKYIEYEGHDASGYSVTQHFYYSCWDYCFVYPVKKIMQIIAFNGVDTWLSPQMTPT